jgi:hypothetical protein
MSMDTTTKVVIGLAALGTATAAYVYWPKKVSAAQPPGSGGGSSTDKALPSTWPSWISTPPTWWTTPPALSVPKDAPKSWTPTSDWIPPWVKAETASKAPGVIGDEYKAGYNDGFTDGAYSSSWGTRQDKTKYAGSPSYKSGYDAGWAEYTGKVSSAGAYVGGHAYVRVSGRMVPVDRIVRRPGSWSNPWREQVVQKTEPVRVGAPRPQPTGPRGPRTSPPSPQSQAGPTNYFRQTPSRQARPAGLSPMPQARPVFAEARGPTAQQPREWPIFLRVTGTVGAVAGGFAQGAWDLARDISRVPQRVLFGR